MSTTHRPVTVRLSQAVLERLDRSMVLSGDDSHSAAVRRLLLLALDHEQKLSAPLDDRIVDLIQTRVESFLDASGGARRVAGGQGESTPAHSTGSVAATVSIKGAASPQSSPGHPLRGRMRLPGWPLTPPYA